MHTPKRSWIMIAIATTATASGIGYGSGEALLIACAIWMSVASDWYCVRSASVPRPTRRYRRCVRDSWAH